MERRLPEKQHELRVDQSRTFPDFRSLISVVELQGIVRELFVAGAASIQSIRRFCFADVEERDHRHLPLNVLLRACRNKKQKVSIPLVPLPDQARLSPVLVSVSAPRI